LPPELGPLAEQIARLVKAKPRREIGTKLRDVLMQFDRASTPPRFSLIAVLNDNSDRDEVRVWLADIALAVPEHLGIVDVIEAATASEISLELVETSYPADVSGLTWRPNSPNPDGAI